LLSHPILTLPSTIALVFTVRGRIFALRISRECDSLRCARAIQLWTSTAAISSEDPQSASPARLPRRPMPRAATLTSTLGRDVTQYGARPGSPDDQTRNLQRAIDEAARAQVPLVLPPCIYRTGLLRLQSGTQLVGIRGATKFVFNGGASMLQGEGAGGLGLSGIALEGGNIPLPTRRGLVHCLGGRDIRISDREITGSGGNGIWLEQVSGDINGNIFTNIATTAVVSFDALRLIVSRNTIAGTNDNGIEILRTAIGDDGALVADNRIEDIKAGPDGSGQYGNAINAFRAGNVIVRGNRIRNCDYSAVRGNSASNIQITGNSVSNVREVALYSEFSFEGAVIANNTVDGAAVGVSVCNFNEGGRTCLPPAPSITRSWWSAPRRCGVSAYSALRSSG
jgi:uncharacterized secreted repeat protein (TIGR03808 family)